MFFKEVPFDEAFPTVDKISVTVEEEGYMVTRKSTYKMEKSSLQRHIPCNNVMCRRGGIDLDPKIRQAVDKGLTAFKGAAACKGDEGSEKGRRIGRKCMNIFGIKMEISYKPATE